MTALVSYYCIGREVRCKSEHGNSLHRPLGHMHARLPFLWGELNHGQAQNDDDCNVQNLENGHHTDKLVSTHFDCYTEDHSMSHGMEMRSDKSCPCHTGRPSHPATKALSEFVC